MFAIISTLNNTKFLFLKRLVSPYLLVSLDFTLPLKFL
ncbi:hypothetical protein BSPWISOX_1291 [uncultured Gammaproteobacteria bacterium]|nr:hypothetical protein BSPWISOX_1291 [uncultured Gammaproteobacteria bacterium]